MNMMNKEANKLLRNGWEPFTVTDNGDGTSNMWFKRTKSDTKK